MSHLNTKGPKKKLSNGSPIKRDPNFPKPFYTTWLWANRAEDNPWIQTHGVNPPMGDQPSKKSDLLGNSTFKVNKNVCFFKGRCYQILPSSIYLVERLHFFFFFELANKTKVGHPFNSRNSTIKVFQKIYVIYPPIYNFFLWREQLLLKTNERIQEGNTIKESPSEKEPSKLFFFFNYYF